MENKSPLSPHIQIYRWHISSLVSISHRITGIINIVAITLICIWVSLLVLGDSNYNLVNQLLNSILGKFIALGLVWSFSFQMFVSFFCQSCFYIDIVSSSLSSYAFVCSSYLSFFLYVLFLSRKLIFDDFICLCLSPDVVLACLFRCMFYCCFFCIVILRVFF